ncbi:MAG: serine/threonine protein kinase [Pyrinomonadaceae bacterium]
MNFGNIVGQTLDGKYKIERELGKGGMGAVYLSTHLGTERPVAVKVIVPEFMERAEFVERFRREARAAGRLRHPNVVDVTDFGIADMPFGKVAYLVMEYLDGCTLGEVLEEENSLPVSWTIDILEQVCSAVQEAHQQGIIHRDLKPDNIWLEPNQRGGYTVKVLDFGIAKLEAQDSPSKINLPEDIDEIVERVSNETVIDKSGTVKNTVIGGGGNTTFAGNKDLTAVSESETISGDEKSTALFESKTLAQTADESGTLLLGNGSKTQHSEAGTLIQNSTGDNKNAPKESFAGTRLKSSSDLTDENEESAATDKTNLQDKDTQKLTRIGAVLGTPLYMSPEQCRGEHLTPQSDIYSLAVIAYQMLDGKTPFEGAFTDVMESHKSAEPPPLTAKKVPRRLKKLVTEALAKKPEDRPKDAESFATVLRAQSEGLGSLYRHAITIYGRHLPKFLLISAFVFLPVTALSITPLIFKLLQYFGMMESVLLNVIGGISTVLATLAGFFFGAVGFGMMTLLVARHLSAPLRPLDLKSAFRAVKQKWKTILGLVSLTSILSFFGLVMCFVPGLYLASRFGFVTPAIVMEDLRGRAALKRSNQLFKRSPWKIITLTAANFILPIIISSLIMIFIIAVVGNIRSDNQFLRGMGARKTIDTIIKEREENKAMGIAEPQNEEDFKIETGTKSAPNITYGTTDDSEEFSNEREREELSQQDKFARTAGQSLRDLLFQLIWFPVAILITSFTQVLMALMYVKTRQAGGEPMRDLLKQFEDDDKPQTRWQKRIHKRLLQSGRVTGKQ